MGHHRQGAESTSVPSVGGARDKVQAYAATVHFGKSPAERAEDALAFYEHGFRAVKLRLHHLNPDDDLKLVAAVMKAAGGKMKVMTDANMGGTSQVIRPRHGTSRSRNGWRSPLQDHGRLLAGRGAAAQRL